MKMIASPCAPPNCPNKWGAAARTIVAVTAVERAFRIVISGMDSWSVVLRLNIRVRCVDARQFLDSGVLCAQRGLFGSTDGAFQAHLHPAGNESGCERVLKLRVRRRQMIGVVGVEESLCAHHRRVDCQTQDRLPTILVVI